MHNVKPLPINKQIGGLCSARGIELDFRLIPQQMLSKKLEHLMSGLKRLAYVGLAKLLPLIALRNNFKTCAAVGRKHRL
jgi:hypothetical protein